MGIRDYKAWKSTNLYASNMAGISSISLYRGKYSISVTKAQIGLLDQISSQPCTCLADNANESVEHDLSAFPESILSSLSNEDEH